VQISAFFPTCGYYLPKSLVTEQFYYIYKKFPSMQIRSILSGIVILAAFAMPCLAQPVTTPSYDLSRDPVLYTVGYAHLDTEWRWDYEETVNDFLKATLDDNFKRFEKYKPYVFSFSGARRYRMMKEYYPEKYEKLKKYIARDRWFVAGSSVDECDVNIPSPESVIRHVLYGNNYFRSEFGKESVDFMLPDCFGFQAWLPSALNHAGVRGFSTQKLVWGSAVGIPFNIGNWTGPDGKGLVAALNATDYTGRIEPGLDTAKYWVDRVMANGQKYGVFADYRYYGVGDVGGAPREADIANAIAAVSSPNPKIHVLLSSSDRLFRDLTPEQVSKLPVYSGDLLLTQHSAGSLTSQAYMKRWNRKNEALARAAEPLAVMADWLGGIPYPADALNQAWWTVLGSQMHDILPGTCIPKAYEYAWNDEVIALNRFASVLKASAGVAIRAMDTQVKGKAVVVYNPLVIQREDIVEAEIPFPEGPPELVIVTDPNGTIVPCQVSARTKTTLTLLFPARVPGCGLAVFDVQPSDIPGRAAASVLTGSNYIENEYYKLMFNQQGDIVSIIDKKLVKELLSGPIRLAFLNEHPDYWPAWNMDWKDRKEPPAAFVTGPAKITVTESGPVRASVRIERETMNSKFITTVQLCTGEAGRRIEVKNKVYWQSKGVSLKASFPLRVKNSVATYNMGLGTIERGNNDEKKYEVPSREWFDLTDRSGSFGISVLEDCKFGSDKPNDSTLRLTLLYTPIANSFPDQATQDWGIHEFTFGIYSHKGDWRTGQTEWQGRRMNQPLAAFISPPHPGTLGRSFSFARIGSPQVDIRAIKKTETGDGVLFRIQELTGKTAGPVELILPAKILSAWETDGQERKTGDVALTGGKLMLDLTPYSIRSIVVKIAPPEIQMNPPSSYAQALPYNWDVLTSDQNRKNGSFNSIGQSIPAEPFPDSLTVDGIRFRMGGKAENQFNVVKCAGQKIDLPKTGNFNKICILASAVTDTSAVFRLGGQKKTVRIQSITGNIGQYDKRNWDALGRIVSVDPGFIKRDPVAWYSTHLHNDTSNIAYRFGYIYKYELDAGPGSEYLQLPENGAILIFAITLAEDPFGQIVAAGPIYDDFNGRERLDLKLEKRYVTVGMTPTATVMAERDTDLEHLPVKLTMKDYADIHQPNGVTVSYESALETQGVLQPAPSLNDGMFELLPGDSAGDIWHAAGEGRVLMDLQQETEIDSLHIFTSSVMSRGPQRFSLWGKLSGVPDVSGDPKAAGWTYIAEFEPLELWGNGKAVYRVNSIKPNRFRYLMWISEDSGYGPYYFREVDLFEKQH
jgi:alpha-mannosidase